jgi:hypothetical protein
VGDLREKLLGRSAALEATKKRLKALQSSQDELEEAKHTVDKLTKQTIELQALLQTKAADHATTNTVSAACFCFLLTFVWDVRNCNTLALNWHKRRPALSR